jgi:hypothetical protein
MNINLPSRMNTQYRNVRTGIILFILVNALLLILVHLLPFQDMPNHLAEATIYKYQGEPGNVLASYYRTVPMFFPNTFHQMFCHLFPSVELGNKMFYLLAFSLLPFSVFLIIRELGGNPWYGLLAVLLTYNYNVTYGFSGFAFSIPLFLLFFYVLLRELREERIAWKLVAFILLQLIFLTHAQMALFGLLVFVSTMRMKYRSNIKGFFLRMVWMIPLVIFIFFWWKLRVPDKKEGDTLHFLLHYYRSVYTKSFSLRFRLPFFDNFQLLEGKAGLVLSSLFFCMILLPLAVLRPWRKAWTADQGNKKIAYPVLLLVLCAGCYLFLPDYLPGEQIIYQRFSPLVIISIIILGATLIGSRILPWLKYYALATVSLYCICWMQYFYSFNRENTDFTPALFEGIPKDNRMGGLIYDYRFRGRSVYIHFPSYYIVWNKAPATSKLIDYRFGVVRRGEKGGLIPYYEEWVGEIFQREAVYDSTLQYLLVHGHAPVTPDPNLSHFELFRRKGNWSVYRNIRLEKLAP